MRRHIDDGELMLSLDGELSPRRQSRIAQHIDTCGVCRDRVGRLRSTQADVDAVYRAEFAGASDAPAHSRVRLLSALHQADLSGETWLERMSDSLGGVSFVRGLAAGVVVIAVCAALIAMRPGAGLTVAGLSASALPESSLTPGAVSELTTAELCNGVRPSRLVTAAVRQQVVRAYRMEQEPAAAYELDALITPELGGSTDPANLWPQRYHSPVWNAHVKDELERLLPEMVCSQQITLAEAQQAIAFDWIAAYKRYFNTDAPRRSHVGPSPEEETELVIVPDEPTIQVATIRLVSR